MTLPGRDPATITLRDAEAALNKRKAEIATGKFDIANTEKPIKLQKLADAHLEWTNENNKSLERVHASCKNLLAYFKEKNHLQSYNLGDKEIQI